MLFNNDFECLMCGECCRNGYIIYVNRVDIENWRKLKKNKILHHIALNKKCLFQLSFTENHENLFNFIKNTHNVQNSPIMPINSISEVLENNQILIPNSFKVMLKSIDKGLDYVIFTDSLGRCPFLDKNHCSIHNYKPIGCKLFPYLKDECLFDKNYSILEKAKSKKIKI